MTTLDIKGRTFKVEGPTPRYGTYIITGPRGATYLVTQAYIGDAHLFKVVSWNGSELRMHGNRVLLTDADGTLRVAK